jgi:hypothetical protein
MVKFSSLESGENPLTSLPVKELLASRPESFGELVKGYIVEAAQTKVVLTSTPGAGAVAHIAAPVHHSLSVPIQKRINKSSD